MEVISAFGIQELGVDPLLIESIDIAGGVPLPTGAEVGGVIRTIKPVSISDLSGKLFDETVESPKMKGMRFRNMLEAPLKVAQSEPQVILFGMDGTLRRMLGKPSKESKMIELIKSSKYPVRSVTAISPIRPLLEGALAGAESQIPPDLYANLAIVIQELEYFVSANDMMGSTLKSN